jgi:hypothetical protein
MYDDQRRKKGNGSEDGSAMQEWIREQKSTRDEDGRWGGNSKKRVRDETRTLPFLLCPLALASW